MPVLQRVRAEMSNFLDSQAKQLTQHPNTELNVWREQALSQAMRVGFPHNKLERWKYAPLRALANKPYCTHSLASESIDITQLPPAPRIVFVNGRLNAVHTDTSTLHGVHVHSLADVLQGNDIRRYHFLGRKFPDSEAPFASLNAALAEHGVLIEVAEYSIIEEPLHVVFINQQHTENAQYSRHLIECHEHSQLRIIEQHFSYGENAGMSNQLLHIHVKSYAQLIHVRIQRDDHKAIQFTRTDAVLASHASYQRLDVETGAHFSRHELNVDLQGEYANVRASGVLWGTGNSTLDTRLVVRHQAPNTQCQLVWRGLADGKARVNFYGGITIEKGADGSNAALSNKNLLLGKQAQINTQPALEIYADEVKAAHGATVGQLDSAALFYLRSRGVPKEQAEILLSQAFYAEALDSIHDETLIAKTLPYLPQILQREQEYNV
jgi:Fe-S cluster assembly protein SufD